MTATWTDTLDRGRPVPPPAPMPAPAVRDCSPWARAALDREVSAVAATAEGERNDRLNAAAYSLGQIVAGGYLHESDVTDALRAAAHRCGLPDHEAAATIASGLRAGGENPRHPEERPATAKRPAHDDWTPSDDDAPDAPPIKDSVSGPSIELVNGDAVFAPLPPIAWLVQGLDICPGPPVIVAGYGFSGKTVAWQSAAVSVCAGLPIWGAFAARRGPVAHIDFEQGSRLTFLRYQRLTLGLDLQKGDVAPFLSVACLPSMYLDHPKAEDELCRIFEGATLGIVDSFRAACPSIEENSSEARRPLDMLARVAERTGVTPVVLLHARKPAKDAPGGAKMAIRGSSALFDAASAVLIHDGGDEPGAPVRVTHDKARTTGRLADPFLLRIDDVPFGQDPRAGLVVRAEGAPTADDAAAAKARAKVASVVTAVRALFEGDPEQRSVETIAAKLGKNKSDVRSALGLLLEAGEVEATGSTSNRRLTWVGPKR